MNGLVAPARNVRLLLLSVAAGCVDAVAFVNAGVFPANMTGNSVVLALALLHVNVGGMLLPALALGGFLLGVAGGARLVAGAGQGWSRGVNLALLLAGILLLVVAGTAVMSGEKYLPALIIAASGAMGLQSAAIQHLGIPGVTTVFVTGTLTTAVSRLAAVVPGQSRRAAALPALTWAAYFTGALLGGLQSALSSSLPLFLPAVLLLAVAGSAERLRQKASSNHPQITPMDTD